MTADDIVKLMLAISVSFSLIGISYALIRFILTCSYTIEDARRPVQNFGELSDVLLEDYKSIRGIVKMISKLSNNLSGYLDVPLSFFSKKANKKTEEKVESNLP